MRVLIVEDELLIALELQTVLEAHGFDVLGPAQRCDDAQRLVANDTVDAVLLDFFLEDGEAQPLANLLHEKAIPFALCSGADEQELSSLYPGTPRIGKPYRTDDVVEVVQRLTSAVHPQRTAPMCAADKP
jgi:DNA-binding response OmpR family regulator